MLRRVIITGFLLALTTMTTGALFSCEGGLDCEVFCF